MKIFKPHELMELTIGNEDYDWHSLQAAAKYKNGYSSSDQTVSQFNYQFYCKRNLLNFILQIQWFWEVFHELPLTEKKKFLLFLTGTDRIPISGMKSLKVTHHLNPICVQNTNKVLFTDIHSTNK